MNNLQRGIYQPLADKVPIYDLADEDPEEERSRAPLLVVIALVVLAAFAGVVWLAYNQGVERGRQGASLVITAPEGPVRVAPPEAAPAPFTGLNVYNDPVSPEQEAKASTLAPKAPPPAPTEAPQIRLSQAAPPPAPATPAPARPAAAAPPAPAPAAARPTAAPAPAAAPAQTAQAARPAAPAPAAARLPLPAGRSQARPCFSSALSRARSWPTAPGQASARASTPSANLPPTSNGLISAQRASSIGFGQDPSRIARPPSMPALS